MKILVFLSGVNIEDGIIKLNLLKNGKKNSSLF